MAALVERVLTGHPEQVARFRAGAGAPSEAAAPPTGELR